MLDGVLQDPSSVTCPWVLRLASGREAVVAGYLRRAAARVHEPAVVRFLAAFVPRVLACGYYAACGDGVRAALAELNLAALRASAEVLGSDGAAEEDEAWDVRTAFVRLLTCLAACSDPDDEVEEAEELPVETAAASQAPLPPPQGAAATEDHAPRADSTEHKEEVPGSPPVPAFIAAPQEPEPTGGAAEAPQPPQPGHFALPSSPPASPDTPPATRPRRRRAERLYALPRLAGAYHNVFELVLNALLDPAAPCTLVNACAAFCTILLTASACSTEAWGTVQYGNVGKFCEALAARCAQRGEAGDGGVLGAFASAAFGSSASGSAPPLYGVHGLLLLVLQRECERDPGAVTKAGHALRAVAGGVPDEARRRRYRARRASPRLLLLGLASAAPEVAEAAAAGLGGFIRTYGGGAGQGVARGNVPLSLCHVVYNACLLAPGMLHADGVAAVCHLLAGEVQRFRTAAAPHALKDAMGRLCLLLSAAHALLHSPHAAAALAALAPHRPLFHLPSSCGGRVTRLGDADADAPPAPPRPGLLDVMGQAAASGDDDPWSGGGGGGDAAAAAPQDLCAQDIVHLFVPVVVALEVAAETAHPEGASEEVRYVTLDAPGDALGATIDVGVEREDSLRDDDAAPHSLTVTPPGKRLEAKPSPAAAADRSIAATESGFFISPSPSMVSFNVGAPGGGAPAAGRALGGWATAPHHEAAALEIRKVKSAQLRTCTSEGSLGDGGSMWDDAEEVDGVPPFEGPAHPYAAPALPAPPEADEQGEEEGLTHRIAAGVADAVTGALALVGPGGDEAAAAAAEAAFSAFAGTSAPVPEGDAEPSYATILADGLRTLGETVGVGGADEAGDEAADPRAAALNPMCGSALPPADGDPAPVAPHDSARSLRDSASHSAWLVVDGSTGSPGAPTDGAAATTFTLEALASYGDFLTAAVGGLGTTFDMSGVANVLAKAWAKPIEGRRHDVFYGCLPCAPEHKTMFYQDTALLDRLLHDQMWDGVAVDLILPTPSDAHFTSCLRKLFPSRGASWRALDLSPVPGA